ncbi:MAG: hypothetical protein KC931_06935 [Candidatus Omnitrophica bacterium]|nr:hypothetical protein [Candidatus Omnitrophota bacterium]MCA9446830.1 hypothetical protein [Candidatus Omnitrophota bacterium]
MRHLFAICAVSALLAITVQAGTIKGKVSFEGTPPPEKSITEAMKSDPNCAALHANGPEVMTEHYVVGEDGGLKWVFVRITEGLEGQKFDPPKESVLLDQEGCLYKPHVFGIQTGQDLIIRNSDATLHNVHIIPGRDSKNPEMNKGMPFKMDLPPMQFEYPEVPLRFKCDVHRWMFAYCNIVDHPFFDTTDETGSFEIKDVPAGDYTLSFWHKKMQDHPVKVTVPAEGEVEVNFTFTEDMVPSRDR